MQFSYLTLVVASTLATFTCAQSIADIVQTLPSCALVCLATGAAAGGCALTDFACQCGAARAAITASAGPCIASGCTADEATKALEATNAICKAAGGSTSESSAAAPPAGATTTGAAPPAVVTQIGDGQIQAPAGTATVVASSFASFPPTATRTTAAPIQVTSNPAAKLNAGALVAGAAVLAAFAL